MLLLRLAEVQNWELQTLRLSANTNTGINPLSASHSRRRIFISMHIKTSQLLTKLAHLWQGQKDSNPQQRFWRPTCYHYTMPLCGSSGIAGTRFSLALFRAFVKRFCENCSELAENRPALYKTRGAWYDEGRKVGGRDARAVGGTGSGVCADAWRGVHAAPRG